MKEIYFDETLKDCPFGNSKTGFQMELNGQYSYHRKKRSTELMKGKVTKALAHSKVCLLEKVKEYEDLEEQIKMMDLKGLDRDINEAKMEEIKIMMEHYQKLVYDAEQELVYYNKLLEHHNKQIKKSGLSFEEADRDHYKAKFLEMARIDLKVMGRISKETYQAISLLNKVDKAQVLIAAKKIVINLLPKPKDHETPSENKNLSGKRKGS